MNHLYIGAALILALIIAIIRAKRKQKANKLQLVGKVALITGAGRGLGACLAEKLFDRGCYLILLDKDASLLQTIPFFDSDRVVCFECDLADTEAVIKTMSEVNQCVDGKIDIVINNAGVVKGKSLLNLSTEDMRQTFHVNTIAQMAITQAVLPNMINAKSGSIVSISSAMGFMGSARLCDYSASKHALIGFNQSLRLELRNTAPNVHIGVVCPYVIKTDMFKGCFEKGNRSLVEKCRDFVCPPLTTDYVADIVLSSIKNKDKLITVPFWLGKANSLLQLLFPVEIQDWILAVSGGQHGMDNFKGN